jgi:hypothetical protein
MIKDYSGNFIAANGNCKKKIIKRRKAAGPKPFLSLKKLMWKTIGAMLLVTLVIGVSSTFWYGWQIQSALDEIGKSKATNKELNNLNLKLTIHRDILISNEHMVKTAKRLGLYPPAEDQLRYPN